MTIVDLCMMSEGETASTNSKARTSVNSNAFILHAHEVRVSDLLCGRPEADWYLLHETEPISDACARPAEEGEDVAP